MDEYEVELTDLQEFIARSCIDIIDVLVRNANSSLPQVPHSGLAGLVSDFPFDDVFPGYEHAKSLAIGVSQILHTLDAMQEESA